MMFRKKHYRQYAQGDLLIVSVDRVEGKDCTPESGPVVLAHGEATGHRHAFYDGGVRLYRPDDRGVENAIPMQVVEQWIEVAAEKALLKHEEHAPVELPRGKYRVVRQREHDPLGDRWVAD